MYTILSKQDWTYVLSFSHGYICMGLMDKLVHACIYNVMCTPMLAYFFQANGNKSLSKMYVLYAN